MSHYFGITLESDEKVVETVRRHPFMFYLELVPVAILAALPAPLLPLLSTFIGISPVAAAALYALWLVLMTVVAFFRWTDYYLDVWIVTTRRVFDIEQHGVFHRTISVFPLENIQDINVEITGLFGTLLKFGNVHIYTAGERQDMIIRNARDPMAVKTTLSRLHTAANLRVSRRF